MAWGTCLPPVPHSQDRAPKRLLEGGGRCGGPLGCWEAPLPHLTHTVHSTHGPQHTPRAHSRSPQPLPLPVLPGSRLPPPMGGSGDPHPGLPCSSGSEGLDSPQTQSTGDSPHPGLEGGSRRTEGARHGGLTQPSRTMVVAGGAGGPEELWFASPGVTECRDIERGSPTCHHPPDPHVRPSMPEP